MSPLLGVLIPAYGLDARQQGSLGFAYALGLMISSLLAGPLVDRKGKRVALVLGLSLIIIALIAAPNLHSLHNLLALYLALGLGGGVIVTGANSLVGDVAAERRGAALNFANLFFGLGGIVTTFAASYLLGPVALCGCIAGVSILALLVSFKAPIRPQRDQPRFDWPQATELLANPTLAALASILALYIACEVGIWNWLKIYLMSNGFKAQEAGGIVSYGFALGLLIGRLITSRALLRVAAERVLLLSGILIVITTIAMLSFSSHLAVTIAVFGAGVSMSSVFPTTLALVGDNFRTASATAIGIAVTAGWLGLALSSPLIGLIANQSSLHQALFVLPTLAGAMVLVILVPCRRLRKPAQT